MTVYVSLDHGRVIDVHDNLDNAKEAVMKYVRRYRPSYQSVTFNTVSFSPLLIKVQVDGGSDCSITVTAADVRTDDRLTKYTKVYIESVATYYKVSKHLYAIVTGKIDDKVFWFTIGTCGGVALHAGIDYQLAIRVAQHIRLHQMAPSMEQAFKIYLDDIDGPELDVCKDEIRTTISLKEF